MRELASLPFTAAIADSQEAVRRRFTAIDRMETPRISEMPPASLIADTGGLIGRCLLACFMKMPIYRNIYAVQGWSPILDRLSPKMGF